MGGDERPGGPRSPAVCDRRRCRSRRRAASDAYFPFPDAFEILAQADAAAVAEPGGSIRDQLTIDAVQAAAVSLYFTGVRSSV